MPFERSDDDDSAYRRLADEWRHSVTEDLRELKHGLMDMRANAMTMAQFESINRRIALLEQFQAKMLGISAAAVFVCGLITFVIGKVWR